MDRSDLTDLVLYRDGLVIVVNKPAGIPVHAGPQGGPNLEAGFGSLTYGIQHTPSLAHRLDRETSGCLALGRHPKALRKLGKLFQEKRVSKTYWALVQGVPDQGSGRIDAPLLKLNRPGGWTVKVDDTGKEAATSWRVLGSKDGISFIECTPETGRTHQIRVHMAHLGFPILGDVAYGGLAKDGPLALHARRLVLPLAATKPPVDVTAPPPDAFRTRAELIADLQEI